MSCFSCLVTPTQEFQQAIKALVPQGHTFKGSPLQCKHLNVRSMVTQALSQTACRDIFETEGALLGRLSGSRPAF